MRKEVLKSEYYRDRFIEKSMKKHGYLYDYSKVIYINSITKVELVCKEHGSFFVRPDAHIRKVGCPVCNGGVKYTIDIFLKKAIETHGDLYNYDKVEYENSSKKVIINCSTHGDFEMLPKNHIIGQKCPSCSGVKRKTTESFIRKAILVHNNYYSYNLVSYINNRKKVDIICKKHGIFSQNPKDHLNGHGCNKCSNFSNGERKIEEILNNMGIDYLREYRFNSCISSKGTKLPFDFYLPDLNIIIEYDGRQHFESVSVFGGDVAFNNLKNNDEIRNKWCLENKIELIRISYKEEFSKLINNLKIKLNI
jgi:very-short-patch-repair endonuclease